MEDLYRSQFRLPQALYLKLKQAAELQHRSLNTELVMRLESTFAEALAEAQQPLQDIRSVLSSTKLGDVLTQKEIDAIAERMVKLTQPRKR